MSDDNTSADVAALLKVLGWNMEWVSSLNQHAFNHGEVYEGELCDERPSGGIFCGHTEAEHTVARLIARMVDGPAPNTCPHCGMVTDVDDEFDGAEITCQGCGKLSAWTCFSDELWALVKYEDGPEQTSLREAVATYKLACSGQLDDDTGLCEDQISDNAREAMFDALDAERRGQTDEALPSLVPCVLRWREDEDSLNCDVIAELRSMHRTAVTGCAEAFRWAYLCLEWLESAGCQDVARLTAAMAKDASYEKRIRDLHEQNELLEKDRARMAKRLKKWGIVLAVAPDALGAVEAGGKVSLWPDLSATGNHAVQSVGDSQPSFSSNCHHERCCECNKTHGDGWCCEHDKGREDECSAVERKP